MAKLTLLGRDFTIKRYMLDSIEVVAPHVDAINETAGALTTMVGMVASAKHTIAILAVGLNKIDSTLTAETLTQQIGFDDFPIISRAVSDILSEAGLAPKGEAKAPSEPQEAAQEGASSSKSETSSPS